jgi:thymidylate synthase (FAD)
MRKVLDLGYVKLIQRWGSDEGIVEAARMSTAKGFLGWGPRVTGLPCYPNGEASDRPREPLPAFLVDVWNANGRPSYQDATNPYRDVREESGDEKLLKFLWDKQHATPFEMAGFIVEVKAPIFVFREWHRHRTQSYNEMSARYVPLPDENYVPTVDRILAGNVATTNKQAQGSGKQVDADEAEAWLANLQSAYNAAQAVYAQAIALGIPKELARLPVPVARYSAMRASANLRNWFGFLKLRCDPAAQWEIRQFANVVADIVCEQFPRTYEVAHDSLGLPS